jgi:hypothetical protein
LRWAALGLLASVVLVCCAFPTIRLGVGGFIGGGESQRTFDLDRDVALVPGLLPRSLVVVIPALALLGTAIAGLRLGSLRPVALAAFAAGVALAVAVYRVETHLTFIEPGAVIGCDHPCTGFALGPGVQDVRRRLLQSPPGHRPGFELTGGRYGYRAHPHPAWWPLLGASIALGLVGGYALARLTLNPWPAIGVVVVAAFAVLVWLFLRALGESGST